MGDRKYSEKQILSMMTAVSGMGTSLALKEIALTNSSFNGYVKRISKKFPEQYNEYVLQKEKNLENFIKSRKELILVVEDMLRNGVVKDDGSVREFDIVDWYYVYNRYFRNVNRSFMSKIFNELDKENPNNRPFLTRKMSSSSFGDNLGYCYGVIYEKDIRDDFSYGLTEDEKEAIITHFHHNNIPFTVQTFNCAAKKIINNRDFCINLNSDVKENSFRFDFMKDDIERYNRINRYRDCFKINKRIR